ncbi:lysozyme inhibitor LprI family protein [Rhodomicrobium lacus]|jgi:uncharacterized protein YecT (DUF1311 family)|uniref:lysozyme inhibitor LprI family protein n=1 Tax=Rhodomicrobium TaxID=1068 RepID=UPI0013DF9A04|nr:lysozyme inhibitor LprI family protein [Rhodomicrobium lacus]
MRILLAVFAAALVGAPAQADAAEPLEACLDTANSTVETRNCIGRDYERNDGELNAIYKRLLEKYSADDADTRERRRRLIEAQRLWLRFRDANCSWQGAKMIGGTSEDLIVAGCLNDMTKDRTKELKAD